MPKLVYMTGATLKDSAYTTSKVIADHAGVEHRAVSQLIRKYGTDLEDFGVTTFEMLKLNKTGRPTKVYKLNEQQASLIITYLGNTKEVRELKKRLVKEFYEMKEELIKRNVYREAEKTTRNAFTEAINNWEYVNQWTYKNLTDMICKAITGMTTKQVKASRNKSLNCTGTDVYSSEELNQYEELESAVILLLRMNLKYSTIKSTVCNLINGRTFKANNA